jgi:hypothetical protein
VDPDPDSNQEPEKCIFLVTNKICCQTDPGTDSTFIIKIHKIFNFFQSSLNSKDPDPNPDPRGQLIMKLLDLNPQHWFLVLTYLFDKVPGRAI